MCGICGSLQDATSRAASPMAGATAMVATLRHRGPDDEGIWTDDSAGVALAQRRLSIVDLSPLGHQPMQSASGRYTVTLNGEIYNFQSLRSELLGLGHRFRGGSDTEVLLAAVEQWGVSAATQRLVGMFAFVVWDKAERSMHLVRDRAGEKPLYYGWCGPAFLFASELKALRAHPDWRGEVNPEALALYLRHNYVPAPHSIYRGIRKLTPGTILTVRPGSPAVLPEPVPYWSAHEVVSASRAHPFTGTADDAAAELERLLTISVRQQMVADVPVGAFLSGGVDSSAIVALMQSVSDRPVRTFTIGFTDDAYNEAGHAKAVAQHLRTDHTELYLSPDEARRIIPSLPEMYDEPFADASQIPTHLVSRLAREHVTVALSGDGGDELFGGYNRYKMAPTIWNAARVLPRPLRAGLGAALGSVPPSAWRSVVRALSGVLPAGAGQARLSEKMAKVAAVLSASDRSAVCAALVSTWPDGPRAVRAAVHFSEPSQRDSPVFDDLAAQMMYLDLINYLPDDILVKVDRAAMNVALETRVPFLDHRVIEFAWKIPTAMHIAGGAGKRVLRRMLYRHVPRSLMDRPKMGFAIPIGDWIRGPLRGWADDLLDARRIESAGFLDPSPIRRLWLRHQQGVADHSDELWGALMFQAWQESTKAAA